MSDGYSSTAIVSVEAAVTLINRLFNRGLLKGVSSPSWPDVPKSHWAFEDIEEASRNHEYTISSDGEEILAK